MSKLGAVLSKGATLALLSWATVSAAQVATEVPATVAGARPATLQRINVHSPAIAGNLSGESADRDVIIVLPPSYGKQPKRRYPVVYALHGYSIGPEQWIKEIHVPQTVEGAFAHGAGEMILVFPDSKNAYNGSMYSSSPATGDFERFITEDLVRYVDGHFRTLARRESRGLVGHSMGGYGAARLSLKHADLFGAVYMMSPCCLSPRDAGPTDASALASIAALKSLLRRAASCPSLSVPSLRWPRRGRPIRSVRRSISMCRARTACPRRMSWRNGRPMRRWRCSTNM